MTDVRIDPADARAIAAEHDLASTAIEDTAGDLPGEIDGGVASGVLGTIMAQLVGNADDLALVHAASANVMRQVADTYIATDEAAAARFTDLTTQINSGS